MNPKAMTVGEISLYNAAYAGNIDKIQELIADDVDLNCYDEFGHTPLDVAVIRGHVSVVRLLLNRGADPDRPDRYGCTALHRVAHEEVAKILVQSGADINYTSNGGSTPLHFALKRGSFAIARHLLRAGAVAHLINNEGKLASQSSAEGMPDDLAALLREREAQVGSKTKAAR